MPIHTCPKCKSRTRVKEDRVGTQFRCPKCSAESEIGTKHVDENTAEEQAASGSAGINGSGGATTPTQEEKSSQSSGVLGRLTKFVKGRIDKPANDGGINSLKARVDEELRNLGRSAVGTSSEQITDEEREEIVALAQEAEKHHSQLEASDDGSKDPDQRRTSERGLGEVILREDALMQRIGQRLIEAGMCEHRAMRRVQSLRQLVAERECGTD